MEVPNAVAVVLHLVSFEDDRGDDFVAGLNQLAADLAGVVPSLLAVSLTLVRLDHDVVVPALAPNAGTSEAAASLAVPLSAVEHGDTLVLQAADRGAFLLLAQDLAELAVPGAWPLEVDRHLTMSPATSVAPLAVVLAELEVVNQAIGVLIDRAGLDPQAALVNLGDRAAAADTTVVTISRRLLADLLPTADADPTDFACGWSAQ